MTTLQIYKKTMKERIGKLVRIYVQEDSYNLDHCLLVLGKRVINGEWDLEIVDETTAKTPFCNVVCIGEVIYTGDYNETINNYVEKLESDASKDINRIIDIIL